MSKTTQRNVILFVGNPNLSGESFKTFKTKTNKVLGKRCKYVILTDRKQPLKEDLRAVFHDAIICNTLSPRDIIKSLLPFENKILGVTCRGERNIPLFQRVIPFLAYNKTPTVESLEWSTNKLLMRKRFKAFNPRITPKFMLMKDRSPETIKKIEQLVGYPLIMKPLGLAASVLVNNVFHRDELLETYEKINKKIGKAYRENSGRGTPHVLVEQFMDGDMFSIDCYVNSLGKVYFCPLVSVKTGKMVGYDDFFAYLTVTPTKLSTRSIRAAEEVTEAGIHALGLRSVTAHVELMKTEQGFKIIEIGPRVGGFREKIYELTYGIEHGINDVLIRIPKKPLIPKKRKGFAAVMKVFARQEGIVESVKGIKKIKLLKSFHKITVESIKQEVIGTRAKFAKNGGKSLFNLYFFNKDYSRLLADIRRTEKLLMISVSGRSPLAKS